MEADSDIPPHLLGDQVFIGIIADDSRDSLSTRLNDPLLPHYLKGQIPFASPGSQVHVVIRGLSREASRKIFALYHWELPGASRDELMRSLNQEAN